MQLGFSTGRLVETVVLRGGRTRESRSEDVESFPFREKMR